MTDASRDFPADSPSLSSADSVNASEPVADPAPASNPAQAHGNAWSHLHHLRDHLPTFAEAGASLLRTVVIALFLLTFVLQPFLIPSESMERTLLVGDFLLFNKQIYGPAGRLSGFVLPYRPVERGDIIVFHHPQPPLLVKRVVGLPGDRLRIMDGRVYVNGAPLYEPYVAFEPASATTFPRRSTLTPKSIPTGGFRCRASPGVASFWCPRMSILSSATIAITARTRGSGVSFHARPSWPARWSSTSR
jgi:signal peptidase I